MPDGLGGVVAQIDPLMARDSIFLCRNKTAIMIQLYTGCLVTFLFMGVRDKKFTKLFRRGIQYHNGEHVIAECRS